MCTRQNLSLAAVYTNLLCNDDLWLVRSPKHAEKMLIQLITPTAPSWLAVHCATLHMHHASMHYALCNMPHAPCPVHHAPLSLLHAILHVHHAAIAFQQCNCLIAPTLLRGEWGPLASIDMLYALHIRCTL